MYVLWARTQIDQSESASVLYNFPSNLGEGLLWRHFWDHGYSGEEIQISANASLSLTGAPLFLTADENWPSEINNTGTQVDLDLAISTNELNPGTSNASIELTVTNRSNQSTSVTIGNFLEFKYPQLNRRVEFISASAPGGSTYDEQEGVWIINNLPGNTSTSLSVTLRPLYDGPFRIYAQVLSSDFPDIDSSPNNGQAVKIPYEDDEASLYINPNGLINSAAELLVLGMDHPDAAEAGSSFSTQYTVTNQGQSTAGINTLKYYLSEDIYYDAQDIYLGEENIDALGPLIIADP